VDEQNVVVTFLEALIEKAPDIQILHGRKTYAVTDPQAPVHKVVPFFKTQLDGLAAEVKAAAAAAAQRD
jgi:hypothetical protein